MTELDSRTLKALAEILSDVPISPRWRPVQAAVIEELRWLATHTVQAARQRYEAGLPWTVDQILGVTTAPPVDPFRFRQDKDDRESKDAVAGRVGALRQRGGAMQTGYAWMVANRREELERANRRLVEANRQLRKQIVILRGQVREMAKKWGVEMPGARGDWT